jgi:hypothetical protein
LIEKSRIPEHVEYMGWTIHREKKGGKRRRRIRKKGRALMGAKAILEKYAWPREAVVGGIWGRADE